MRVGHGLCPGWEGTRDKGEGRYGCRGGDYGGGLGEERGDGESVSIEGEGYGGAHERWNGDFAVEQS